jgi:hypothetical protein
MATPPIDLRRPRQVEDILSEPVPIAQAAGALVAARLRAGREVRFTITSSSMWPALMRGDEIVVRAAEAGGLRPGEIAFLKSGNIWLAHRLIEVRGAGEQARVVTKADNHDRADEPHPAGHVYGRVVAVARAGRQASLESAPARWFGGALARLSRAQGSVWRERPGPLRQAALRSLGLAVRLGARAARRALGLRQAPAPADRGSSW